MNSSISSTKLAFRLQVALFQKPPSIIQAATDSESSVVSTGEGNGSDGKK